MNCDHCGKRIRQSDATETANGDMICLECLHEDYIICEECGAIIERCDAYKTHDQRLICDKCYCDNYATCDDCGDIVRLDYIYSVDDGQKQVCNCCLESNYYQCEWCDEWFSRDEVYRTYDGNYVCHCCSDSHYYCCDDCGYIMSENDYYYSESCDQYFCPDCWNNRDETILDYHDFDAGNFDILRTGNGDENDITFGFELEVSGNESYAKGLLEYFNDEVILMHDGSIKDGGFEIITMPMTESYFYEKFLDKFKKGLQYLTDNEFNGHNYGGLHIHLSAPPMPVVAQLSRLMYCNNEEELKVWQQLTQRKSEELHWCKFETEPKDFDEIRSWKYPDRLTKNYTDRYVALNFDHRTYTYEFRIFNSNLRIERFLKNFEIVKSLLAYCKKYEKATIPFVSMREYLKFIDDNKIFYPNLYEFINEKHIYLPKVTETRRVANGTEIEIQIPDITFDETDVPF